MGYSHCFFCLECWATVNSEVEYIFNVSVGSINNTTGWSPNGYGDYSHLSTTMHKGSPYPITITIGNPFIGGHIYFMGIRHKVCVI